MLGTLAQQGNEKAASNLVAFALGPEPQIAENATEVLADIDDAGIYKAVHRRKAAEGHRSAIMALASWDDPGSADLLESIAKSEALGDEAQLSAKAALNQLRMISNSGGNETVLRILSGEGQQDNDIEWALKVSMHRKLPGSLDILKKRLLAAEDRFTSNYADWMSEPSRSKAKAADNLQKVFAESFWTQTVDYYFDEILIAYSKMGGQPTDMQHARLKALGYSGNPKARLAELLGKD